jgi:iron complex outermembrane receptor protein
MIRHLLFIGLVFLVPSHGVVAQQGYIRGRVTERETGAGLPGATVMVKKNQGTVSDSHGTYLLKADAGIATLTVSFVGYRTEARAVRVILDDTISVNVSLVSEISEIDQVVISASRIEQRVSELTVSMSVIKPEILTGNHITDSQELINKTPGIEVLDGQASIRGGSGYAYGAGSRVLALIDGLPVLAADAGNIRWQFLPLDNVSQIEIIKGASSVSYGSSALNGIINFRTADASSTPVTRYYIESGFYGAPDNKAWKWWDSPRLFTGTHVSHTQRFGKTDIGVGINFLNDNGYRTLNNEKLSRLHLKLKHRSGNVEGLSYGLGINSGNTKKTDFILWEDAVNGALRQNAETAIELNANFLTIDPFLTYRKDDKYRHDLKARIQSSVNKYPDSEKNNSNASNSYLEYQYYRKVKDWISFLLGVSENYSSIRSNFYGDHHGLNMAAFAQGDLQPAERLKIVSGFRFEYNALDGTTDDPSLIFRAGINYKAAGHTFLRASFGQGYRYPSVAEKHAATTLGSVKIFPNIELEPESGWNSEVGVKQGLKAGRLKGQLDAACFFSRSFDMIEYIFGIYPDPVDGSFNYGFKATNMEASQVVGCDTEFFLTLQTGRMSTTCSGGYTYLLPAEINRETKKKTGAMLKYRRSHSAVLNLNTSVNRMEFGLGVYAKSKILSIDDVFLNPLTRENILPGFYDYWLTHNKGHLVLDATVGYSLSDKYSLSFVVKNLANTEYMGRPGDIQPMRNFSLRLGGRF